ncbi:DoxX family protein [Lysinibacillus sp. 54212]|uniref:DoxX family protein n=1 Tax=Lysinibacillus sp. 54212 TaxID=3119829 RepID=UPI002FC614D4
MEVVTWVIQGLLSAVFAMAGFGKVTGSRMHIDSFRRWRYPQWFRIVTGVVELLAATLLIIGIWATTLAFYGVLLLVAISIGGILTHMRIKDTIKDTIPIASLGVLGLILAFLLLSINN